MTQDFTKINQAAEQSANEANLSAEEQVELKKLGMLKPMMRGTGAFIAGFGVLMYFNVVPANLEGAMKTIIPACFIFVGLIDALIMAPFIHKKALENFYKRRVK